MPIFRTECWLPRPRAEVFAFFADAFNLQAITPAWLHFVVLTPPPIRLGVGSRIDYRLRLHGLPLGWRTEITCWEPPVQFVDEQRRGPYRRWRHSHYFEEQAGGTLCSDRVEYEVPGGWLVDRLLVRRDIERIFLHRHHALWAHLGPRGEVDLRVERAAREPR